jgi:hypothetical protein
MFTFPVGFFNLIVSGGGGGTTDPFAANVVLFLKGDGTNGSTNIVDSSPSPKTITVNGNAQISTAQSKYGGSSLLFDGSGDYLSIPATGDMLFSSQNFTWEAWIYPTTLSASYRITLMGNARASAGGDYGMHLQVKKNATNQTMFSAWANENGSIGSTLNLNQWNHIACTRVGTTVEIFVNGIKGTTGSCATSITSHTAFLIGTVFQNDGYANDYTGYIDSLRLTRGVVRYTANFNPETDTYLAIPAPTSPDPHANNVVLFLKGDGTNGSTNIVDSSPSPKTISVFGNAQISTAQSKYGGSSLYFDGTNNCFIGTPADSIYTLGSSNFTLEMWIRPFTANPNGILGWNNSATFQSGGTGNPVYSDFGGKFSFWRQYGGVNNLQQLIVNVWQHHALVRDGNNYRWYLNGILTMSFTNSETLTGSRICIGTQALSPPYVGFAQFYLSHLRLTKSVRYTANFNPETDTYLNV